MDRPDLDEFLSALDGFLERQSSPKDAGSLKFLDIFCRSVGSSEGHMLKAGVDGRVTSFLSFGLGEEFNQEFNALRPAKGDPAPMEIAHRDQKVVAIVNLKQEKGMPAWFTGFIDKHKFKSLVAVPLLSHNHSVGVLCAYYDDVCLFDQGTMDRLMIIGRMVGVSLDKRPSGEGVSSAPELPTLSRLIKTLEDDRMSRPQLMEVLTNSLAGSVNASGVLWGPLQKIDNVWNISVAAGTGIKDASMNKQLGLPKLLAAILEEREGGAVSLTEKDWGNFKSVVSGSPKFALGVPMKWGGELQGGVLVWRDDKAFDHQDRASLSQVAGLASIILNSAGKK